MIFILKETIGRKIMHALALSFAASLGTELAKEIVIPYMKKRVERPSPKKKKN